MWEFLLHGVAYASMAGLTVKLAYAATTRDTALEKAALKVLHTHILEFPDKWSCGAYRRDDSHNIEFNGTQVRFDFYNNCFRTCYVNGAPVRHRWGVKLLRASQMAGNNLRRVIDALRPPETPLMIQARKEKELS